MKRVKVMLLALCLMFQIGALNPVAAQGAGIAEGEAAVLEEGTGILVVEARSSQIIPFRGNVTVQVRRDGMPAADRQLQFGGSADFSKTAEFQLAEGEYEVKVKAAGFAEYAQNVRIEKGWISKALVCSAEVETGSGAKAGWIRPGDVNGDGEVDSQDAAAALSAAHSGQNDSNADINGDGRTDLADLQTVAQSMDNGRESGIEKLAIVKNAQTVAGTAVAEGSLESFWNRQGVIALKPQDDSAEISEQNPVGMEFVLAEGSASPLPIQGIVIHTPETRGEDGSAQSEISDGEAVVTYVDDEGNEQEAVFSIAQRETYDLRRSVVASSVSAGADGSLVLDFGTQIAVKRVTIRITGTRKTEPLVTIAEVEFVNNMEEYIPAPKLDIPELYAPVPGSQSLTVSWSRQDNVTGYEVCVTGPVKNQSGNETQIVRVSNTQHRVSSINNKSLKNFATYTLKVRSVNGDWHSPWSDERTGEPKPGSIPAPPDNVRAEGGYRTVSVSWKDMDDANGYMVYYKKRQEADSQYRPAVSGFLADASGAGRLNSTSYVIGGLEDKTEYNVYVVGWNELGWGRPSLVSVAMTTSAEPPKLPNYKLLNTSNGEGKLSSHIKDATFGGSGGARMIGSALDTEARGALGLLDNDYGSYWMKEDWDDGVAYPVTDMSKGFAITLDQDYQVNYITFAAAEQKAALQYVRVMYWDSEHEQRQSAGARLLARTDQNGKPYYIIKLDKTVSMNKVYICLGRDYSRAPMLVGEVHFHRYDSLEDDIMALYADEMHTTLRGDVTEETIAALEARLETEDAASGEKHPLYPELALELKTAREILGENLEAAYEVDNGITAKKDTHLGFGGLNAWQPLGKTANAGESILVYVGHNTLRTGDKANLQLIFTQQHAESSSLAQAVNLKVGRNEITVPRISSLDYERGGQIYVAYTGNSALDQYAVRISGGSSIPVLRIYGKTGSERMEAIRAYVSELEEYVSLIESAHGERHAGTQNESYNYDAQNCILNATDIMMREMMYSLPATQVWAGIRNAGDKADKLDKALQAMEQTMTLFYQHKGLSDSAGTARGNNALPAQHLNIRYMRMFAGAFMYAAGNHIGIEWGSATLASAPGDWSGFGWGIAHEIGHNINQGSYAVAEVTNNYYAQLLTGKRRYTYENVYKKVTSGTKGRSENVFTQLAMYWQLHLAFDDVADDRTIFDDYEEQFNSLFFARADTYSRNPSKAPKAGLALNAGSDQNLMRLSCTAAGKDILSFFERWGMEPDQATIEYASKYEKEEKALYYVNEDARDYRIAHPGEEGTVKGRDVIAAASVDAKANQAKITVSTSEDADLILGYEISRSMITNGQKTTEVIGFAPAEGKTEVVYTDTVAVIDNRVMEYEVRAVDKYLNYSNAKTAGSVKIQTEGILDKTMWTAETTLVSNDDADIEKGEEDPDSGYDASSPGNVAANKINSIEKIIDGSRADMYRGSGSGRESITIDMRKVERADALKYDGEALAGVTVEVSVDGSEWTTVKENCDLESDGDEARTVWFDSVEDSAREDFIGTYDVRYVRLSIPEAGDVCIREIDVCAPSGDNLEFMEQDDGQPAIGVLENDYQYGSGDKDIIPKGSLIFTGTYKGNPAYNVVVLYDMEGNVIGEKDGNVIAKQVIFAEKPKNGNLGETSEGTWVYYVEPGQWDENAIQNLGGVRGELYRVDNALTLEGERIVSDTLPVEIPGTLPSITLKGGMYETVD